MMKPNFDKEKNQLFLDLDGVFCNFDMRFYEISGMWPKAYEDKHGSKKFWDIVNSVDEFFYNLDLHEDADELFKAVRHLNPIFLTGGHDGSTFQHTKEQKERWVEKHFPGTKCIVTKSKLKSEYMKPGDVIVDDWEKYMHIWEEKGGHWVLHKNTKDSINKLKELGVLERG